jgi:heme/copper-type cytochrome/quinol oxidase subunit 2
MCGQGHFSMRKVVKIVEQAEYDKWIAAQKPLYTSSVQGTEEDTYGKEAPKKLVPVQKEGHTERVTTAKPISMK